MKLRGNSQPLDSALIPADIKSASTPLTKFRWYGRVPIAITLATAIGFLVLLTAGGVFGVGAWIAQKNTFDLISANAHQALLADIDQIEQYLRPAEHQARFIAERISEGEIDPKDRAQFEIFIIGALAAVPQIEAVVFINSDMKSFGVTRQSQIGQGDFTVIDNSNDPVITNNMTSVLRGPLWQPPIWRERFQTTYVSRAHPAQINGEFIGAVLAVVSVKQLSDFVSMNGQESAGNQFILYGQDSVLAHWLMVDGYPEKSDDYPLPRLVRFGDPVLSSIWQDEGRRDLGLDLPDGTEGHILEVLGSRYVFFYKRLPGFGEEPLIVGTYFQASDRPEEIERMLAALMAGFIALCLSLLAAIFLGRRIARPIVEFSSAATRIRDLDVSKVQELPGSVFRELNDQSVAFNAMLRALRWFEFYVPKKIVEQLIRHGDIQDSQTTARQITVMFTDVVGFSAISEEMLAEEVASFINHHFSIVVSCIENENGTVDKFMGDAVMAFWQDSDTQAHSPEQACRAALAISKAIQSDNDQREMRGEAPVGLRIGIHTGGATVGNIGAPGRLNYTIIGDTVNIGQRLESLGKDINPSGDGVSILISGDTAQKLTPSFKPLALGSYKLYGRVASIEVYKLEAGYPTNISL
ncbi:MAG: adenylate/guanylate cyclase domain-containing protein [Granulosicoccus sp.]